MRLPYPDSHGAPVHELDLAAVARTALTRPGHEGAIYPLTGPESLTQRRQVELVGKVAGRPIRVETVPVETARRQMATFFPPDAVDVLLGYQRDYDGVPRTVYSTVEEVTGQPARNFARWAADNVADFR